MLTTLTTKQAQALAFIRASIERTGMPPTLREICAHMGYSAVGSAQDIIQALRRKGFIEASERQAARCYVLTPLARQQPDSEPLDSEEDDPNTLVVRLLGTVPAGSPVAANEALLGTLRVSKALLAKPHPRPDSVFGLRAKGDSMIGAGILDGDWLVVQLRKEPPHGSVVVARLDGEVTVKRLVRDQDRGWCLHPENARYQRIYAADSAFEIIGQVVALQRSLG